MTIHAKDLANLEIKYKRPIKLLKEFDDAVNKIDAIILERNNNRHGWAGIEHSEIFEMKTIKKKILFIKWDYKEYVLSFDDRWFLLKELNNWYKSCGYKTLISGRGKSCHDEFILSWFEE